MASCAVAVLYADARRRAACRVIAMNTILVVNAASSSLKFQVVQTDGSARLHRLVKGQMDGIGTRPGLRAQGADRNVLIDRSYSPNDVTGLPAALQATAY